MKRPNSGWKTGAVVPLLNVQLSVIMQSTTSCHLWKSVLDLSPLKIRYTATLLDQVLIFGQCFKDVGLPQRQPDLASIVVEAHD
jgi:hypothetical protein